jgi:hypothetical protein
MRLSGAVRLLVATSLLLACAREAVSQHVHPTQTDSTPQEKLHQGHGRMTMLDFGGGWMALGMAQVFPTVTIAAPKRDGTPLDRVGFYLTQPAVMFNVESPGSRIAIRTTINLEGLTQPNGELTFGGWGEGFIDKRHPHTYLHEAMVSLNLRRGNATGVSLSAGKGFAPYGTDDPMMRPVLKYPTNHHLSQILERWTVNGIWANHSWSVEAGLFGGAEPSGPSDLSNIESFGDSWSARVTRRFGEGMVGAWPWEIAASFGRIQETHEDEVVVTRLYNVAFRHEGDHGKTHLYSLVEASQSDPDEGDGYYSLVGELSAQTGRHKPYARIELATRPEWARQGPPDTEEFFRYDHDAHAIGSTRWLIVTGGYGLTATTLPFGVRPYVESQYNLVRAESGGVDPIALFRRKSFWTFSAGFRVFLGGDPMRMGSYGILDPMTMMHLMQMLPVAATDSTHHD